MTLLDSLTPSEDYFDAAQGLYWYCADWHGGQSSNLYSILSTLGYKPAMGECGPEEGSVAEDIYRELESGDLDADNVVDFVNLGYEETR